MDDLEWWTIEQKTHDEIVEILKSYSETKPWVNYFIQDYPMYPGSLSSVCRIGFVPFKDCIQDRYYLIDKTRKFESVAAGGIVTQINWDHRKDPLPDGWQGSVRKSFLDAREGLEPNTMVALLAFTLSRYRKGGLSERVLSKMCVTGQERGYKYMLLPALPPSQFEENNVRLKMDEIIDLKRDDGKYYDYWLRIHTRKGAEIIGSCETSHRFIFSLKDFSEYVSSDPVETTGEHVIRMDKDLVLGNNSKNMWQLVYADIERSFVTFDWGCVWARYDLEKLHFDL